MNNSNFLIVIFLCLFSMSSIAQISESEVLPEGILFARYPDSLKPANPVEGLCFYNTTLKMMECYDGTVWRTVCGTPTTTSTDPSISCQAPSFVLDNCMLTVSWAHDNPISTTVNYDLRINGEDPGLSVTYPASSNTIDVCTTLGINSGSGVIDIEMVFWYDGDFNSNETLSGCLVNYNF